MIRIWGVPDVVQLNQHCLCSARRQVLFLGLAQWLERIQHCHSSSSEGCNWGPDLIPGPRTPCAVGWPLKKKKERKKENQSLRPSRESQNNDHHSNYEILFFSPNLFYSLYKHFGWNSLQNQMTKTSLMFPSWICMCVSNVNSLKQCANAPLKGKKDISLASFCFIINFSFIHFC